MSGLHRIQEHRLVRVGELGPGYAREEPGSKLIADRRRRLRAHTPALVPVATTPGLGDQTVREIDADGTAGRRDAADHSACRLLAQRASRASAARARELRL